MLVREQYGTRKPSPGNWTLTDTDTHTHTYNPRTKNKTTQLPPQEAFTLGGLPLKIVLKHRPMLCPTVQQLLLVEPSTDPPAQASLIRRER